MLQAAARIADGQVPYSDFWWFYPPGQPYLLAGLWELFGPSLLPWRILRVACDAGVAVLVWSLARRGGASPRVALAAWLCAALAMAYPTGPHPFPPTLVMALGVAAPAGAPPGAGGRARRPGRGLADRVRRVPVPRRAAGLRAAAGRAAAAGAAVRRRRAAGGRRALHAGGRRGRARRLVRPARALSARGLLRLPVAAVPARLRRPAEHRLDRRLPERLGREPAAVLPAARADARPGRLAGGAGVPIRAGALVAARRGGVRGRDGALPAHAPGRVPYGAAGGDGRGARFMGAGGREGSALRALAWPGVGAAARARAPPASRHSRSPSRSSRASTAAGSSCAPTTSRFGSRPRTACACAPTAATRSSARCTPCRRGCPPGRPIYVATRRSDLVTSGDPLFYVLADRPNPTRYDIQAPGVITSAPVQREIVRDLERARPRAVVRFTSPVTAVREPNRAGESTGVTILDDYLARAYRRTARFGPYVILGRTRAASRRSSRSSAR